MHKIQVCIPSQVVKDSMKKNKKINKNRSYMTCSITLILGNKVNNLLQQSVSKHPIAKL